MGEHSELNRPFCIALCIPPGLSGFCRFQCPASSPEACTGLALQDEGDYLGVAFLPAAAAYKQEHAFRVPSVQRRVTSNVFPSSSLRPVGLPAIATPQRRPSLYAARLHLCPITLPWWRWCCSTQMLASLRVVCRTSTVTLLSSVATRIGYCSYPGTERSNRRVGNSGPPCKPRRGLVRFCTHRSGSWVAPGPAPGPALRLAGDRIG